MTYFVPERDNEAHLLASTIQSINMFPAIITNVRLDHLMICNECSGKLDEDAAKRVHEYGKDKLQHLAICKICYDSLDDKEKTEVQSFAKDMTKQSLTLVNSLMAQRA